MSKDIALDPSKLINIWERSEAVISSYFTTFLFEQILLLNNALEVAFAITGLLFMYMVIDQWLRVYIIKEFLAKDNGALQRTIFGFMDYLYYFGIFFVVQFVIQVIKIEVAESGMSLSEMLVLIFCLLLISYSVIETFKQLQ